MWKPVSLNESSEWKRSSAKSPDDVNGAGFDELQKRPSSGSISVIPS